MKTIEKYLFVIFFITYAYFYNGAHWNQNARLDSIYSLIENSSFKINQFLYDLPNNLNTGDWAKYKNDYYSNKAPGTLILGSPIYEILYSICNIFQIDFNNKIVVSVNAYIINIFVSILPVVIGLICFFRFLIAINLNLFSSLATTLSLGLGTMLFPYSTQLWGGNTAAAFLLISLYQYEVKKNYSIFGLMLGSSILCDYLAIIPAVFLFIIVAYENFKQLIRVIWGGLPCICILFIYNYLCFESPFRLPPSESNPIMIQKDHFLGLFNQIDPLALYGITFSLWRGIFISMPILLLAPLGYFTARRVSERNIYLIISTLIVVILLLVNSSFNGWPGGATVLSRYQLIAMPFWAILLSYTYSSSNISFIISSLFSIISVFNMLIISAVGPIQSIYLQNPLYGYLYKEFFLGNLPNRQFPHRFQGLDKTWINSNYFYSWNFGNLLGLSGLISLLPLIIFLLIFGYKIIKKFNGRYLPHEN